MHQEKKVLKALKKKVLSLPAGGGSSKNPKRLKDRLAKGSREIGHREELFLRALTNSKNVKEGGCTGLAGALNREKQIKSSQGTPFSARIPRSISLGRVGNDFWLTDSHGDPNGTLWLQGCHMVHFAYNNLWMGNFICPDWDVFQSLHPLLLSMHPLDPYLVIPFTPGDSTAVVGLACDSLSGTTSETTMFPLERVRRKMHVRVIEGNIAEINIMEPGLWLFCRWHKSLVNHRVDGIQNAGKEIFKLERELKFFSKSSIKSIHTKLGDIVDCIDIYKQPAFDHPLLKNHKLQREPSFQTFNGKTSLNTPVSKPMSFGLEKDECPTGTVPIPRMTTYNSTQAKTLYHTMTQLDPGTHAAQLVLVSAYGPYYQVQGATSIYNPRVKKDQVSASLLWVQKGATNNLNKIVAGWHVFPQLYGDEETHIYAAWTSDNFKKTGCYNYHCKGFVQIDKQSYLSGKPDRISVINGVLAEIGISINQDSVTKNWWLIIENKTIGYFPAQLFSNMSSAEKVGWGGFTRARPGNVSPPMGSGLFPDGQFVHASYFRNISYQNVSRLENIPSRYTKYSLITNSDCFGLQDYGYRSRKFGYTIEFGGPGGACGN
ncbi:hypothetical protein VNO77_32192 [Canavalia gladiata]|uniref:Neprosin PEP catalytic domain-containing protein n=1 Tax=Canavalia gladiata TaxID=3824 RepID=A0AAN9KT49_CANGL